MDFEGHCCSALEIYDIAADRWTRGKDLPIAGEGCLAGVCMYVCMYMYARDMFVIVNYYVFATFIKNSSQQSNILTEIKCVHIHTVHTSPRATFL